MISRLISGIQLPSNRRWVSLYSSTFKYPSYTVRWRLTRISLSLSMAGPGKKSGIGYGAERYIVGLLPQDCEIRYRAADEIRSCMSRRSARPPSGVRAVADQGHRDHRWGA